MASFHNLDGVYAAAVTPLTEAGALAQEDILPLLDFLARRGCHGALLFGTTGEGPSFAPSERLAVWRTAVAIRQDHPDFKLLAGTGTPSLDETVSLTRAAFELGYDGALVLPPYYFRDAPIDSLFAWFSQVLSRAVPAGKALFGYHFPAVSGVGLHVELLARLKEAFPERFAGLKDSSSDPQHARLLGERFGSDLVVFSGNDPLLALALQNHASGCITALANIYSPELRRVWEAHRRGEADDQAQRRLLVARSVLDRHPPAAAMLKAVLARQYGFPRWQVRPPLLAFSTEHEEALMAELSASQAGAQISPPQQHTENVRSN